MDCLESDVFVVGGGLAGAMTTFLLMEEGVSVTWIVNDRIHTSTRAGAGVMNPVTGRNFTLSWRFRELLEEALSVYRSLERKAQMPLLHRSILLRSLPTPAEENGWCIRLADPAYAEFMSEPVQGQDLPFLKGVRSLGVIDPVWRVDMQAVVEAVRLLCPAVVVGHIDKDRKLTVNGALLDIPGNKSLVLATGAGREMADGLGLPLRPFKGESLIISSPDLPEDRIIYHDLKVVPLGSARFWVGPSDPRDSSLDGPTPGARSDLIHRFESMFDVRYTVQSHEAGVRPASVRRRPFAGRIPGSANDWVINGLGTKGASLAPFAARSLVQALLGKAPPDPELTWPWPEQPSKS